jgi:hypothetical protein
LSDHKKTIKLIENAGFKDLIIWNQFTAYNFTNFEEYYQNRIGSLSKIHSKMRVDEIVKLKDEIKEQFQKQIKAKMPLGLDVLYIVGMK